MKIEQGTRDSHPVFLSGSGGEYVPGVNLYRHLEHPAGARPVLIVPPLGNTEVAIEYFARRLEILTLARFKREFGGDENSLLPSPVTDYTKEIGILDAPATICFPFKIDLGFLMESLAEFEQTRSRIDSDFYPLILTHASGGYCRERTYGALLELTLRDSPRNPYKDFDFYVAHESLPGIWTLISDLSYLSGRNRWGIVNRLNEAIERLDMVEKLEDRIRYVQSLGVDFYAAEEVLTGAKHQAVSTDLTNLKLKAEFARHLVAVGKMNRIRSEPEGVIAITGEIFHCEELMRPSSHDLGKELLQRGFYFTREVGLHHYTPRFKLDFQRLARFFWSQINPFKRDVVTEEAVAGGSLHDPGGHGKDIVSLAESQKRTRKYDGILEIYPFNCTPSVVVASIVNGILKESNTPYLRLQMDEQTGKAGFVTRIEAFLDMIQRKKTTRNKDF